MVKKGGTFWGCKTDEFAFLFKVTACHQGQCESFQPFFVFNTEGSMLFLSCQHLLILSGQDDSNRPFSTGSLVSFSKSDLHTGQLATSLFLPGLREDSSHGSVSTTFSVGVNGPLLPTPHLSVARRFSTTLGTTFLALGQPGF